MTQGNQKKNLGRAGFIAFVGVILAGWCDLVVAQSNIVPDETLGKESSQVRSDEIKDNPAEVIEGGAQRGANLFHSFSEFDVENGRGAYFTNPVGIENILSRVTGTNPSEILGTLGVTGGNANLFLINPNGIIFGENARLDVAGSFVGTTANTVQFGEQGFFDATEPNAPTLLTVQPSALLLNQINPGRIENRSTASAGENLSGEALFGLRVPDGKSLMLLGGDVVIDGGGLNALGGRVELGGLAATGNVGLDLDGNNLSSSFPEAVKWANISLTDGAKVDVTVGGGGSIAVNANNLEISGTSQLLAGIGSGLGSVDSQAGDITANATSLVRVTGDSGIFNEVEEFGLGNAGKIKITATNLELTNGGQLDTSTYGQGDAGSINVNARNQILFDGIGSEDNSYSGIFSQVKKEAQGQAGDIDINVVEGSLTIENGAELNNSTFGEGNAGNIVVNARDTLSLSGQSTDSNSSGVFSEVSNTKGRSGNIGLSVGSLSVTNGAFVSNGIRGEGNAGNIIINARNLVSLDGAGSEDYFSSGIYSRIGENVEGQAGDIDINIVDGSLSITNGAQISAGTRKESIGNAGNLTINTNDSVLVSGEVTKLIGGEPELEYSRLTSRTEGSGNAGNLTIDTGKLIIQDGAQVSTGTVGKDSIGNGGDLTVNASDLVQVIGEASDGKVLSRLTTRTEGSGNAGNLTIDTRKLIIQDGAQVSAGAIGEDSTGDGGNLTINASDLVQITGESIINSSNEIEALSRLTNRTEGSGNAKNLEINTKKLIVQDGGQISADTFFRSTGKAGTVNINVADYIELSGSSNEGFPSSLSSKTTSNGDGGDIVVSTKQLNVINGAEITTENRSLGNAGNLNITTEQLTLRNAGSLEVNGAENFSSGNLIIDADKIDLDNQSFIEANSESGREGNITLNTENLLTLRRNSNITTNATGDATGGNITINATDGFVIAVPEEDSDITANALQDKGGRVFIDATNIFGIEPRTQNIPRSDITASSELGTEFSGEVEINTPDIDPNRGLIQLPTQPIEAEVAQACTPGNSQAQSEFVVTGRGGLPPTATETLSGEAIAVDLVSLNPDTVQKPTEAEIAKHSPVLPQIVEAQGMVVDDNGEPMLVAATLNTNFQSSWQNQTECNDN